VNPAGGFGAKDIDLASLRCPRSYLRDFTQHAPQGVVQKPRSVAIYFHLHLVSDSTGETLNAVAKAACAQFDMGRPIEHVYPLVRNRKQLDRAMAEVEATPGLVLHTMVNQDLREQLEARCRELGQPSVAVLDPVMSLLGNYLGAEVSHRPGAQHDLDARYFARIEALNFTMAHDDGQSAATLDLADVVLVGVSRTSKTPTCIYLANRGIKAANIPIVLGIPLPPELDLVRQPLIVGLLTSPERLIQIRKNRLLSLNEDAETDYVDLDAVRAEVAFARRLFGEKSWPVIDVTRRSIEETAAAVIALHSRARQPAE
jgi:[pyruvate, water dikinase]-phosphate phosphotransferase / [pyruvate, water dikinase] kinase